MATQSNLTLAVGNKETLLGLLNANEIQSYLPSHLAKKQFSDIAVLAAMRTPKLYSCIGISIIDAMGRAAQLGLDFSGVTGQGYVIPYWNSKNNYFEAKFIIGYKGMIDLAMRSYRVKAIYSHLVYKQEVLDGQFRIDYGTNHIIEHKPNVLADYQQGDIAGAYAIAVMDNGVTVFEFMRKSEIDAIRRRSRAADSGPWVTDYGQMARKTVIRRLCNVLPQSPEIINLLGRDQEFEEDDVRIDAGLVPVIEAQPIPQMAEPAPGPTDKADNLADKLSGGSKRGRKPRDASQEAATEQKPAPEPPKSESTPFESFKIPKQADVPKPELAPAPEKQEEASNPMPAESDDSMFNDDGPPSREQMVETIVSGLAKLSNSDSAKMLELLGECSAFEKEGKQYRMNNFDKLRTAKDNYIAFIYQNVMDKMTEAGI